MTTPVNGLIGGLVVGLLAAGATNVVAGEPPVARRLLAVVRGEDRPAGRAGTALQVVYGGVAGAVLVLLELFVLGVLSVPPALGESLAVGVAWSGVLFVVAVVAARATLGSSSAPSAVRGLLAYHLVYGVGLGLWIRLTWIT